MNSSPDLEQLQGGNFFSSFTKVTRGVKKVKAPVQIAFLGVLSVVAASLYNTALGGAIRAHKKPSMSVAEFEAGKRRLQAELQFTYDDGKLGGLDEEKKRLYDERVMEVTRTTWPECVEEKMTCTQCKQFVDNIIHSEFTGDDVMIRAICMPKRRETDEWYNSIVIPSGDNGRVCGRDGDGKVYYDFLWEGSGEEATDEEQASIHPVIGYDITTDDPNDPKNDPTSAEYKPLIINDEPMLVEGASVRAAKDRTDARPISGGFVTDPDTPNKSLAVTAKFNTDVETALNAPVPPAGPRALPPFDCAGLSAYDCCLLVKATVKDKDVHGKAIQCFTSFCEDTKKNKFFLNNRGKKVHIFCDKFDQVKKVPKIVGNWNGAASLEDWVEAGGSTPVPY